MDALHGVSQFTGKAYDKQVRILNDSMHDGPVFSDRKLFVLKSTKSRWHYGGGIQMHAPSAQSLRYTAGLLKRQEVQWVAMLATATRNAALCIANKSACESSNQAGENTADSAEVVGSNPTLAAFLETVRIETEVMLNERARILDLSNRKMPTSNGRLKPLG